MSILDTLIYGYRLIAAGGKLVGVTRNTLNFIGATAVDNPLTNQTDVTIVGGGQGGWNLQSVYQDAHATPLVVPSPGAGYTGVSQPFSNNYSQFTITMPAIARGVLVKLMHTSGDAVAKPIQIIDPGGNPIQDPQNFNLGNGYQWTVSGATVVWEGIIDDGVYGPFWKVI